MKRKFIRTLMVFMMLLTLTTPVFGESQFDVTDEVTVIVENITSEPKAYDANDILTKSEEKIN